MWASVRGTIRLAQVCRRMSTVAAPQTGGFERGRNFAALLAATGVAGAAYLSQNRAPAPAQCDAENFSKTTDVVLGNVSDFNDGEMYDMEVFGGRGSVLLAHVDGQFHCVGASCTHYSAPLVKGVVTKDHVSCPWHDAEFDLKTGLCTNGPGLDAIPVYPVKVTGGKVVATLPLELKEMIKPKYAKRDPTNKTTYVIVGGGAAATTAAETMRMEGFTGRIIMLSNEKWDPYDRPVLSKNFQAKVEDFVLRDSDFFKSIDVEFIKESLVTAVDPEKKTIEVKDGPTYPYDKCLVVTGAIPRRIPVPGHDSPNVYVVRTPEDRDFIAPLARAGTHVVVVGSSFIGMECAASLAKKGAVVSVIGMEKVPFERVLGFEVGKIFGDLLKEKKINYEPSAVVQRYKTENGKVCAVEIKKGDDVKAIKADAVVLGAGVVPNTKMVKKVEVARDGSIYTDAFFKSKEHNDLYLAGDIARFPWYKSGHDTRIEHWDVAMQQGRIAAANMVNGDKRVYKDTPFFWTLLYGHSI
eukprot:Cvel_25109.t1-p1 / transcript=Cvel_25109.t1 / gene=Cvel_25109 / organism=Chromera_velia_CCMP2878 / gene_product=Apoptosis-inducing factor 3, putative / transcript_product=Apoptosis-inducing factor 3, putative / location=Cvel_scaffold2801:21356-23326(+) / protein_length=522 / sequence_SO=supercontig / SO=protein_coding / is_pseudo=false